MRKDLIVKTIAAMLLVSGVICSAWAQHIRVGVDGGVARFTDETSSGWSTGYSIGGHIFYLPVPMLHVGLRIAYDHWSPEDGIIIEGLPGGAQNLTSKGKFSNIELVPSIRLSTGMPESSLNFFGQAGAGLYLYNSDVTVSGTASGNSFSVSTTTSSNGNFGVNLGGGLSVGKQSSLAVELFPLYHWVFHGESNVQYFTVSLSVMFGI